ncbi:MAG: DUF6587 family protein [Steroidobacteraceae bacterium]
MTLLVQQVLVLALCAAAALFATWRLLSPRLRLSLLEAMAPRFPAGSRMGRWLANHVNRQRAAAQSSGCSACGKKSRGA